MAQAEEELKEVLVLLGPDGPVEETWEPIDSAALATNLQSGSVYLIRSGRHHKVGRTNQLGRRMAEIKLQLPERADLIHMIETDDAIGIERYWHTRFADRRANGEWFLLSRADVAAFKRRRFM